MPANINSNRASCFVELELYRHALKDCNSALSLDSSLVKAYLVKGLFLLDCTHPAGKAQWGAKKNELAISTWKEGQKRCDEVYLFIEFEDCINGRQSKPSRPADVTVTRTPVATKSPQPTATKPAPESHQVTSRQNAVTPASRSSLVPSQVPANLNEISGEQFDALADAAMGRIVHGVGDARVDKAIGKYQAG